ncbi:MAG: F0F1 ATP synthase subunit gamma [Phycisphaerae bacterium]|nr:F0F1 ATP synthase subunit gamma [Phycisphaerae bacterium]
MPNTREIIKRRDSVSNICKITKTMEMIATSKFKKAYQQAYGSRPYTEAISHLVGSLAAHHGQISHPLLRDNRHTDTAVVIVITSNRGLCGSFNDSIVRLASEQLSKIEKGEHILKDKIDEEVFHDRAAADFEKYPIDLRVVGKKGIQAFKNIPFNINVKYTDFDDIVDYGKVEDIADELIDLYSKREISSVKLIYTRFVSTSLFFPEVLDLLPLSSMGQKLEEGEIGHIDVNDYIFSPGPEEILNELIPNVIRTELYQCFAESVVSEQVSRMRSMQAASDAGDEMIKNLSMQFNRARQSQITGDLLDVVGGAEILR